MAGQKRFATTVIAAGFAEAPNEIPVEFALTRKHADWLVRSLRQHFPDLEFRCVEWSSKSERLATIPSELVMAGRAFEGAFTEEHQEVAEVARRIGQVIGCRSLGKEEAARQTEAEGSSIGKPPKPPRLPSKKAFQAWSVRALLGITDQTEIAEEMTRRETKATQGQVSKWLRAVEKYQAAGGILPDVTTIGKPQSVDPDVLDMGARQDHRTPRQRERRDPDADSDSE